MSVTVAEEHVDRFRAHVARRFGLSLETGTHDRIAETLAKAAGRSKDADAATYVRRLEMGGCPESEIADLVKDLTVSETYFFRHPDHFRAVCERVLLERFRGPAPERLRMLSAGCASGEEAYSLAILIRDHIGPDCGAEGRGIDSRGGGVDARVVGIDLNPGMLEKARQGRYTTWSLRGVSNDVQERHFERSGRDFVLTASVRQLATFVHANLLDDDNTVWQPAAFDVIFCRNVLMYFTPEAMRAVIGRLTRSLAPGGFLFLGPAETLRGTAHDFHLQHSHDTFYYQRHLATEPPAQWTPGRDRTIELFEPPAPIAPAIDDSWVATICRSSERIASLTQQAQSAGRTNATSAAEMPRPLTRTSARAPDCLEAARRLVLEERFEEALRLIQSLPPKDAAIPEVQLLTAAVLTNVGRLREAEQICREVLANDELNAEAHYLLALCGEHTGEIAAAMEQDQMAIYLDPQFAMPQLHLGLLAKRMGDRGTAREAFRKAALLLPQEDGSRIALFGGGFDRQALVRLCQTEVRSLGGVP